MKFKSTAPLSGSAIHPNYIDGLTALQARGKIIPNHAFIVVYFKFSQFGNTLVASSLGHIAAEGGKRRTGPTDKHQQSNERLTSDTVWAP